VLIDKRNLRQHLPWIAFFVAATLAASAWYFFAAYGSDRLPGGSSLPGFTFGVIGGLFMLFEFFLWPRKKLRTWRIGRAQTWMRAHIWLGLLTVPLIVLHSGFRLGEQLSAVLMILFAIVIASGLWGLALQQFVPKRMLNEIPGETIYSQIDRAITFLESDAEQIVISTCGERKELASEARHQVASALSSGETHRTVGAMRKVGNVQGKVLSTFTASDPVAGSERISELYESTIATYLKLGAASSSPLISPGRSTAIFQDLRTRVSPAAHGAVAMLEDLCSQRRQFDRQRRMHKWLHSWLLVHLPLSVALIVLMFVHIYVALKYW
jgi:hypothetical protein